MPRTKVDDTLRCEELKKLGYGHVDTLGTLYVFENKNGTRLLLERLEDLYRVRAKVNNKSWFS